MNNCALRGRGRRLVRSVATDCRDRRPRLSVFPIIVGRGLAPAVKLIGKAPTYKMFPSDPY